MQAIIMTRISTREQEMGHSIEAQLQRLQDYAERHKLDIIQTYSIVESSTKGSRKKFMEVVAQIQRSKYTVALVTDTVDRLLRSFKQSIILDKLREENKVHLHFIRENLILTKESNSADLIRWDIAIMFSKSYVLMMRDNIMRSMKHKVQHRGIINHLPTGYLHHDKKGILDPVRAPLIRQLFELYATGDYSIEMLHREITLRGLTSKSTGRPLTRASIHNILNNTTYYGTCKAFGKDYTPDIEPIITHDLWQRCQDILRDRDLNPCKIQGKGFLFKRLITCSECGSHISFIEKKSRYVYGYCDRCRLQKRGHIYVREELLTEAVIKEIAKLRMPDELYRITVSKLLETAEFGNGNAGQYSLGESGTDLLALKTQIARLMDLYLKGGIDSSEYSQKLAMLRSDEEKLIKLKDKKAADLNPFRQLANILLIAQQALLLFKEGTPEIKRSLLKFLFMELKLDGKRLITTMCYPFSLICEEDKKKNGRPFFFFWNFPDILKVILPNNDEIRYTSDALNRRIAKMKNGNYEYKLLYSGQLSPIARLNDEDRVVEEYVYGSRVNVPEYMIKDGRKYRFLTDHRGSVRMVVDTHDGTVMQRTDYDEFGLIIDEDLAENWTPVLFGYAGGLHDRDTGLIRFGARDYDPMVGRWTSKEPLGFNGSSNFYVYAGNDPVNYVDPDGNLAWFIPLIGGTAGGIMGGVAAYYSGQDFWGVARSASVGFFAGALSTIPIPGARMWLGSAFSGMVTSMGANIFLQYLEDDPCEENYDWDSVFRSGIAGAVGGSIGGKLASFPEQKIPHAVMIKELRNGLPLFTENASDAISSTVGGFAGGIMDTALQK